MSQTLRELSQQQIFDILLSLFPDFVGDDEHSDLTVRLREDHLEIFAFLDLGLGFDIFEEFWEIYWDLSVSIDSVVNDIRVFLRRCALDGEQVTKFSEKTTESYVLDDVEYEVKFFSSMARDGVKRWYCSAELLELESSFFVVLEAPFTHVEKCFKDYVKARGLDINTLLVGDGWVRAIKPLGYIESDEELKAAKVSALATCKEWSRAINEITEDWYYEWLDHEMSIPVSSISNISATQFRSLWSRIKTYQARIEQMRLRK